MRRKDLKTFMHIAIKFVSNFLGLIARVAASDRNCNCSGVLGANFISIKFSYIILFSCFMRGEGGGCSTEMPSHVSALRTRTRVAI